MKRLEIELAGKKYPFFRTMRSQVMFARSKFTTADLIAGNMDAIMYSAYCLVMGASLRERVPFKLDYEGFIDVCPDNVLELIISMDAEENTGLPLVGNTDLPQPLQEEGGETTQPPEGRVVDNKKKGGKVKTE